MFTLDIPDIPQGPVSILVAQANQAQIASATKERAVGYCMPVAFNHPGVDYPSTPLGVEAAAADYFFLYEKRSAEAPSSTDVELVVLPKHGRLIYSKAFDGTLEHTYVPNPGYTGDDKLVFKVKVDGNTVRVVLVLKVTKLGVDAEGVQDQLCKKTGKEWKISVNPNDSNTANSIFQQVLKLTRTSAALSNIPLTFADLPNSALAQTFASSITLDDNATGHGWFVDATSSDNEEFLPTSNPNVWVTRPGSTAEGKMDMLSVLMHEYGHVLGLDHSTDANDVMAAILQPGVRKLWSESDLAKLNEAIASNSPEQDPAPVDRNSDGLPVGGQTRITVQAGRGRERSGSGVGENGSSDEAMLNAQALRVVNATLENGDFQTTQTWDTHGAISFENGEAVLTEADNAMSSLTQAFVMQEGVKGIRFTIKGLELGNNGYAPSDAFEVAVLDALTGLPVAGVTTQTRTDALFNLQANGVLTQSSSARVGRNFYCAARYLLRYHHHA